MTKARYAIEGLLVGPYLPNHSMVLGGVTLNVIDRRNWETSENPISAQTDDEHDSLITFTPNKIFISTTAGLSYECNAASSKDADALGSQAFERVCDALNVSCIGSKYYFQVSDVKRLSPGIDPESRLSEAIHVVNYESRQLDLPLEKYTSSILSLDDPDTTKIITAFGKALRDGNTFEQYKVLEMITHTLSTEVKAEDDTKEKAKEEAKVVTDLLAVLQGNDKDDEKKKAIKKSSEDLRRLNLEQNGKRIAATAEYLGLNEGCIKIVNDAIRYRNKVMAHFDKPTESDSSRGPKDVQESARFFVIQYLNKKFELKLPQLDNVSCKDYWYRITYANSSIKN